MSVVFDDANDSGMASLGTTPYFFTMERNMSHCPPSHRGSSSRNATSREVTGSFAVARMFWKNQLARSYLSQNRG